MAISFDVSPEDRAIIDKIVTRARKMYAAAYGENLDRLGVEMDLLACHANGTPLRLLALLEADDVNFAHDVFGIRRHIDRDDRSPTAGLMLGCFVPRFADTDAMNAAEAA